MKKILIAAITMLAFAIAIDGLQAKGTKEEAKALVQKAIAYYKANGKDKVLAEASNKKGQFVKEDLYVTIYDMKGTCLAHGTNPKMIGKVLLDAKDPDGKQWLKERIDGAKKNGSGWQEYKFNNPTTYKIEPKIAYYEKVDDLIFTCGAYK